MTVEVFIGIGSNISPEKNVQFPIWVLGQLTALINSIDVSPAYRSAPVGFKGDDFINLVVRFDTEMPVGYLQAAFDQMEMQLGREPNAKRFAPRPLDIDILLYGDQVSADPKLPRPDILNYAFVLKPLTDLAPAHLHPMTKKTFAQHWQEFEGDKKSIHRIELPPFNIDDF